MNQVYRKLLTRYIVFTIIIAIVALGTSFFLPLTMRTPALPFLIPFFLLLGLGVHAGLLKMSGNKFSRFVNAYLVASFLKLFLYLIVMVIYIYLNRHDALPFAITFLVLYIAYSVFEVITFLSSKSETGS